MSMTSPPSLPRVGWIGTGVMGGSMCSHILHKGYPVVVNTRSKEKAQGLLEHGAAWAATPFAASAEPALKNVPRMPLAAPR